MRNLTYLLVILYLGCISQVLAADPEPVAPAPPASVTPGATPAAVPPAATPTTAASSAAATAATAAVASAPSATGEAKSAEAKSAEDLDKQIKRLRSQGYKPKVAKNGTTLFCRSESTIGSRFPTERCGTAEELDRAALYGKETTEEMQRKGNMTPRSN
jgi:hypothetical protein